METKQVHGGMLLSAAIVASLFQAVEAKCYDNGHTYDYFDSDQGRWVNKKVERWENENYSFGCDGEKELFCEESKGQYCPFGQAYMQTIPNEFAAFDDDKQIAEAGIGAGPIMLIVIFVISTLCWTLAGSRVHANEKIRKFKKEQKKMQIAMTVKEDDVVLMEQQRILAEQKKQQN